MPRFRRYRIFLVATTFLLLLLYYLSDTRGWGGKPSLRVQPAPETPPTREETLQNTGKESVRKSGKSSLKDVPPTAVDPVALASNREQLDMPVVADSGKDQALEFPHKKISDGPEIDVELPKGKHDKHTATSTIEPVHFTPLPDHFPVPDESIISLPTGAPKSIPRIQHNFARETTSERKDRQRKQRKIKKTFLKHWAGYKEHAWDHDELRPVSGGFLDPFAGWRATLVDTLDMLWIMGLKNEFEEAIEEVRDIDFTTTSRDSLPLFEVVIRYLGGLIAAYDISDGKYTILLEKAKELAEVLMPAFDTPNRMPMTFYRWKPESLKRPRAASQASVLAEIGSLNMEFIRLAQITQNNRYYDAVARITDGFEAFQNQTKIPGLWPLSIDATGGCAIGDLTKDEVEAQSGTNIDNKGTSNEKDVGRKIEEMIKEDAKSASKKEIKDALGQKDKTSFAEDRLKSSSKTPQDKAKSTLEDDGKDVDRSGSHKSQTDSESSKSFAKRVPPGYAKESLKQNSRPSLVEDEVTSNKMVSSEDDDSKYALEKAASGPAIDKGKSGSRNSKEDEYIDSYEEPKPEGKSLKGLADDSKTSKGESIKTKGNSENHKEQSNLEEENALETERYTSVGKDGKSDREDKPKQKDKSSSSEDKAPGKGKSAAKVHDMEVSGDKLRNKDKSSFADDVDPEPSISRPKQKPVKSNADDPKKEKGKHIETDQDENESDAEERKPKLRHNKPMHKCVTRGLRSQYGDAGIDKFTLGGQADSVYEYLPKAYLLLGGLENQYRRMHETMMPAMKEYLLFRAMTNETRRAVLFTGLYNSAGHYNSDKGKIDGTFTPRMEHLTCFQGAFIALAGRAFRNEKDVDLARRLTEGCVWSYEQMATGIMPETFELVPCVNVTGSCKFNQTRWWNSIEPYAEERVKMNIKSIADKTAELDTNRESTTESKRGIDSLVETFLTPSRTSNVATQKELEDTREAEADPEALDDSPQLERRRPPSAPTPQTPEEARSSLQALPTTVPDYMNKLVKEQHLKPGISRLGAREYILRPEAIESVFYMYRITGDPYWREKGWHMFESINNATAAEYGNSAISDVTAVEPTLRDKAESFWTAETLKYFWLLFSEPDQVSLDDWVFNTEAHPFRRPDLDIKREREAEQVRRRKGMGGNMVWDLD